MSRYLQTELIKRIVVRGPNWVGDAVMCTPALRILRDLFPSALITLLVKPTIAELLRSHPSIDGVIVYEDKGNHAGFRGKLSLIRKLKKERYDLAVLFQNAFEAALLMWLSGIPRRMGYPTDGRGFLLNHSISLPSNAKSLHQVEYYQQLLASFVKRDNQYPLTLTVPDDAKSEMEERLKGFGVQDGDFLIGLNPGSVYGGAKRWLPERFAETVDRLIGNIQAQQTRKRAVHCVVVGAPGEENLGRTIGARMRNPSIVLSGQTTLPALMAIIRRCQLFVTNDTGPMHIANAFGVPIVAIFGPTDHRTTSPFQDPYAIVRNSVECSPCLLRECPIDHRCMTNVSVDDVVISAEQLISSLKSQQVKSLG